MRGARLILLMVLAASCRTRPIVGGERVELTDGGTSDLAPPACVRHTLEGVPLTLIELQDAVPPSTLSTTRIRVTRPLGGCDLPGQTTYDLQVGDATDWAALTAQRWRADRACGAPVDHHWVMAFQTSNIFFRFSDTLGDATLVVERESSPNASCDPAGPGNSCEANCQCSAIEEAGCVLHDEGGACLQTCNHSFACRNAQLSVCVEPGRLGRSFCASGAPDDCSDCPFPFRCEAGRCEPPRLGARTPCACQSDCAPGQICDATSGLCATPCIDDRSCPPEAGCFQSECRMLE